MRAPKSPILTVDGIILNKRKVLLVKRALRPFLDSWTLPGGHVDYGETVEKAIKREMKEELGIPVKIKELFGVYSDPKRDPRYHTATIVYLLGEIRGKIQINEESSGFKYFPLKNLPKKIGFDHRQILNDLKKKL
jgi:8-oxo-dGTP diphosphatase